MGWQSAENPPNIVDITKRNIMSENNENDSPHQSSVGTVSSEAKYLDTHYEAAKDAYEASAEFVGFEQGWSILDAGAGGGSFIPFISTLLGASGRITAIDLDPVNVATIEERHEASEFACPVEAHVGSITQLPFDDNSFDAIWCAAVQQYLTEEELALALQELRRVVRPGGLIAIKDWDHSGSVWGMDMLTHWNFVQTTMENVPMLSTQSKGCMRIIKMPFHYRQHNIEPVDFKTFIVEWHYPVPDNARSYLESQMAGATWMASLVELPEHEAAFWARWADPNADDYFLNSPDYFTREAHGVAIGRKPL